MPIEPKRKFVERRRGEDIWTKSLRVFAVVSWILIVVMMTIFDMAKPVEENFIDRFLKVSRTSQWNTRMLDYMFMLMVLGLVLSVTGLWINIKRNRRRNDHLRISLIIMGLVSVIGVTIYIL